MISEDTTGIDEDNSKLIRLYSRLVEERLEAKTVMSEALTDLFDQTEDLTFVPLNDEEFMLQAKNYIEASQVATANILSMANMYRRFWHLCEEFDAISDEANRRFNKAKRSRKQRLRR